MAKQHKIVHIDMDAFFASVEQLDNPELRGRPVVVGGLPRSRGVVAAASYEARRFGIRSAMASSHAYRLCADTVFVAPRFSRYRELSGQIRSIFHRFTVLIEPLSLDEAYLDVTGVKPYQGSATLIAKAIKRLIQDETGLVASAGVSYNKFLAKLASDMDKPDGLYVITPEHAVEVMQALPVERFYGVGKATAKKMYGLSLKNAADIRAFGKEKMLEYFGKAGNYYYHLAHGIDHRQVNPYRVRKSIGCETTYVEDLTDFSSVKENLLKLTKQLIPSLDKHAVYARTITIKVKYFNFKQITRSQRMEQPVRLLDELIPVVKALLLKTDAGNVPIRLLGVSVSNLLSTAQVRSNHNNLNTDLADNDQMDLF